MHLLKQHKKGNPPFKVYKIMVITILALTRIWKIEYQINKVLRQHKDLQEKEENQDYKKISKEGRNRFAHAHI